MKNKFVFVIPAFNCEETIKKTLFSIIAQSYTDYRIIVCEDMSTDQTSQVVEDFKNKLSLGEQLVLFNRTEKYGEVRNTLSSLDLIEDDEIVCRLDGGDWLTDNDGLYVINEAYKTLNPAVLWTAHRWGYTGANISGPLKDNISVYKQPWVSSHLKTFRKSSFKNINHNNFRDSSGNFIMIACDQAIFLPLLHKSLLEKRKCVFLPLVMYHYDFNLKDRDFVREVSSSERAHRQARTALWIRERGYIE